AAAGALPGLPSLLLAVAGRGARRERTDQLRRCLGHLVHRAFEDLFVRARGPGRSAQFADELRRRGPDLLLGRRRIEVGERLDVTAHGRTGYRAAQALRNARASFAALPAARSL